MRRLTSPHHTDGSALRQTAPAALPAPGAARVAADDDDDEWEDVEDEEEHKPFTFGHLRLDRHLKLYEREPAGPYTKTDAEGLTWARVAEVVGCGLYMDEILKNGSGPAATVHMDSSTLTTYPPGSSTFAPH